MFSISVVVVRGEEVRRGRVMGESTREGFESHSGTGGGRREERDRSMAGGSFHVGKLAERRRKEKGVRLKFFQWGHVVRVVKVWGRAGSV